MYDRGDEETDSLRHTDRMGTCAVLDGVGA
jgi:hypothetical protein